MPGRHGKQSFETASQVGALLDAAATSDAAYAEAVTEFDQRVRLADAVERTASPPKQEDARPVLGT